MAPKLDKLKKLLEVAAEDVPSTKDVAKMFSELVEFLKKTKQELRALSDDDRISLDKTVSSALSNMKRFTKDLEKRTESVKKDAQKDISRVRDAFLGEIARIERQIPGMPDLSIIERSLERLEAAIPKEPTAEKIRDLLETLEGEEKLSVDAISGLTELLEEITKKIPSAGAIANPQVVHWPRHESFTMNGSDTTVTLAQGVSADGTALIVRYQGQTLDLTTQYTVSGNKITLVGFTPETSTSISVTYWP